MKKFLFIAIAFIAFQTSNAQSFAKGDTFVEGTVKYSTSDNVKTFNFNPSVGYFVTDKLTVGISAKTESTKDTGVTTESTGFGVFARCYFLRIGEHLNIHSQLGLNSDKSGDTKTFNAKLGLGANYFVTKNLSLTLSVANLASYKSVKDGDATTTIGIDGVNNPFMATNFGVNYRF